MPITVISLKEYQSQFKAEQTRHLLELMYKYPHEKELFEKQMNEEVFYTIDQIHENMFDIENNSDETLLPIHATYSHNFEHTLTPHYSNPSPYVTDKRMFHDYNRPLSRLDGVADNFSQISNYLKEKFEKIEQDNNDIDASVVITATPILKSCEPADGGWRWHKWGKYIGLRNPKNEYIHDEDDTINVVWCFSVIPVIKKEKV